MKTNSILAVVVGAGIVIVAALGGSQALIILTAIVFGAKIAVVAGGSIGQGDSTGVGQGD